MAIAAADYGYQWWKTHHDLMMTRDELKEEMKNSEGNQQIKSARRRRRATSKAKMLAEVPQADVVLVNPTHIAVALRYDRKTMKAPKIVAPNEMAVWNVDWAASSVSFVTACSALRMRSCRAETLGPIVDPTAVMVDHLGSGSSGWNHQYAPAATPPSKSTSRVRTTARGSLSLRRGGAA